MTLQFEYKFNIILILQHLQQHSERVLKQSIYRLSSINTAGQHFHLSSAKVCWVFSFRSGCRVTSLSLSQLATAINSNKCGMAAWKIFIKSNNALSSGSAIIQRATFCGKLGKLLLLLRIKPAISSVSSSSNNSSSNNNNIGPRL